MTGRPGPAPGDQRDRGDAHQASDPRTAGFVRTVVAIMNDPQVGRALQQDEAGVRAGLLHLLETAQRDGEVRDDVPAARLAIWVMVVLDGFGSRVATDPTFDGAIERELLADTVARLLATGHPAALTRAARRPSTKPVR